MPRFGRSYPIPPLITKFFGATAVVTGTAVASIDEDDITTGGKTIIITLAGDTWKAAGAAPIGSESDSQALLDGLDAATSPALGWNDEVRDKEVTGSIVRDSNTQCTITLTAAALYDISSTETITVTVPTDAIDGATAITATPTFTVNAVSAGIIPRMTLLGVG